MVKKRNVWSIVKSFQNWHRFIEPKLISIHPINLQKIGILQHCPSKKIFDLENYLKRDVGTAPSSCFPIPMWRLLTLRSKWSSPMEYPSHVTTWSFYPRSLWVVPRRLGFPSTILHLALWRVWDQEYIFAIANMKDIMKVF